MCLKIYEYRTYCDPFSFNPPVFLPHLSISVFLSFLHPALSSSHLFLSLYDKSPTITSFSLSLSDSLQCNYTDCPLKRDTHAHINTDTHTQRGKPISNISGCSCSFFSTAVQSLLRFWENRGNMSLWSPFGSVEESYEHTHLPISTHTNIYQRESQCSSSIHH